MIWIYHGKNRLDIGNLIYCQLMKKKTLKSKKKHPTPIQVLKNEDKWLNKHLNKHLSSSVSKLCVTSGTSLSPFLLSTLLVIIEAMLSPFGEVMDIAGDWDQGTAVSFCHALFSFLCIFFCYFFLTCFL